MNNVYRKTLVIFLVVIILSVSYGTYFYVSAQSSNKALENYVTYSNVLNALNNVGNEINTARDTLKYLHTIKDNIVGELADNSEDMRQNLRSAIGNGVDLSLGGAVVNLMDQIEDTMDGVKLLSAFDAANESIETYIERE